MSSDIYFVLIADHVFSATELRRAYYSDDLVFAAAADCLSIRWIDPRRLTITCGVKYPPDPLYWAGIEVQKHRVGDVAIGYVNIPDSGR